uniref:Uncharacterized protein n=1 Tax=Nelumbo nucifera TaxID=4432 RepID=A0A822XT09_NELNU|nr:TPA_asm: hypothetical protein HUJ06_023418 [Nelumbo nucifera]
MALFWRRIFIPEFGYFFVHELLFCFSGIPFSGIFRLLISFKDLLILERKRREENLARMARFVPPSFDVQNEKH